MKNILLILIIGFAAACTSTIVPKQVHSDVASWDGTNQNSGLLLFLPDNSVAISDHARERYNGLVKLYGDRFVPPVKVDDGLTRQSVLFTSSRAHDCWVIDPEHLAKFAEMNRWKKAGL